MFETSTHVLYFFRLPIPWGIIFQGNHFLVLNFLLFSSHVIFSRTVLEYASPVWNGALAANDVEHLEKVQILVLKLLLQRDYSSYTEACECFSLDKLAFRKNKLSLHFAKRKFQKSLSIFVTFANTYSQTYVWFLRASFLGHWPMQTFVQTKLMLSPTFKSLQILSRVSASFFYTENNIHGEV